MYKSQRATSHTRLRARDQYTSSLSLDEKVEPVQVRFLQTTLEGPMEWVCECKMDVKSTWIPTWHQMDHVSWSLGLFSKIHLSEVGLIQYRETTALQMLTTVDLFCFIMWGPARIFYLKKIAFGWGLGPILLHTTLEDPWAHYMILEVSWEGIWALSFGFSQFHGHGSWLLCEVALRVTSHTRWRACDHCVLQSLSGRIGRDCPSSLHTRRWRPKGPNKLSWMKNLHGRL